MGNENPTEHPPTRVLSSPSAPRVGNQLLPVQTQRAQPNPMGMLPPQLRNSQVALLQPDQSQVQNKLSPHPLERKKELSLCPDQRKIP